MEDKMLNIFLNKLKRAIESLAQNILPRPSIEGIEVKYLEFSNLTLEEKIFYLIILAKS